MGSAGMIFELRHFLAAAGVIALLIIGTGPAGAQTFDSQESVQSEQIKRSGRPVGIRSFSNIYWQKQSQRELYDMRLFNMARRLERTPGVMENNNVWMARADVCDEPGDEILLQVRSPLTCGTLGCQIMVISEASGAPRVILSTIGNSIDGQGRNALSMNEGTSSERQWSYRGGRFQQMRN